ncbi:hypothetical protein M9H77_25533 [Catharanthus roseus]|uniref:Uncharacterized protein n=1 Tax=Catharanthus roseus TaxID=4058 RepID=A0ACC0A770_CATRO|nr:hypothetical protein M9H77_25533 [Catharanthus roseus]
MGLMFFIPSETKIRLRVRNTGVPCGNLIHLKYSGLTNTFLPPIPSSIGKLKSLQVLEATFGDYLLPRTSSSKLGDFKIYRILTCTTVSMEKKLPAMPRYAQLKFMYLSRLCEFEGWQIHEKSLPTLRGLGIYEGPKLKLPRRLRFFTVLQRLDDKYVMFVNQVNINKNL